MPINSWLSFARGVGAALGFFALGILIRWPIQGLMGTKLIWLTFYPVIVFSALVGGFWSGLLTSVLSVLFVGFGWALLSSVPYVAGLADQVGMGIFLVNAVLIALVAEVLRRSRARSLLAQRAAEEANRTKSVFLAQMSHELRTPFNALLGFTSLLLRAPEATENQKSLLSIVHRSGVHLLDLINNVLAMTRSEAGQTRADLVPLLIGELVDEVVVLLKPKATDRGLALEVKVAPQVPRALVGDPTKLRHILLNLVGNAVKFSARGTITVSLTAQDRSGSPWVVLAVCDQGPGIDPRDHERIFVPFERLESGVFTEGSGLGLAIVRAFASAIGGRVWVESTLGQGACFFVEFPAPAVSYSRVRQDGAFEQADEQRVAPDQPNYRFLVVDDHPDNRRLLESVHGTLGLGCHCAENGQQAVEAFKTWQPDLIWMDLRMPVLDGFAATAQIRALPGGDRVKIVAVTASVFRDEQEQLHQSGFDEVLGKPFPLGAIPETITRLLGLRFLPLGKLPEPVQEGPLDLGAIGEEARLNLLHALETLDPEAIDACVRQVQKDNPKVGTQLRRSVENLDYTGLRRCLLEVGAPGGRP